MIILRVILAILIFSVSIYLTYDLFNSGFDIWVLFAVMIGFIAAHYIWPKPKKREEQGLIDLLDIVIDLPYNMIAAIGRSCGRLLRHSDDWDINI